MSRQEITKRQDAIARAARWKEFKTRRLMAIDSYVKARKKYAIASAIARHVFLS